MSREFKSLLALTKTLPTEKAAVEYFTAIRWKNGAFCPACGEREIYHYEPKSHSYTAEGTSVEKVAYVADHKCKACRKRFTIKVGTVMEGTKIGVREWLMAIWLVTNQKKGIASTALAGHLGVTQKTAWFMLHRLRHAARTRSFNRPLGGTVETDEAFVGGKDKNKHSEKRGLKKKAVVVGLLERGGELRAETVPHVWAVPFVVTNHVAPGAKLMTDEALAYRFMGATYQHETVNHRKGEYGRGPVHTNGIEGYWSHLKRQIYGVHHWVSTKHLQQYVAESVWRYNRRDVTEGQRVNEMIARLDGRLKYEWLTAN